MMNRYVQPWLRPACALFCGAGILLLTACGGGNGAPNNPYTPPPPIIQPISILPSSATVYQGTPTVLTVTGGVPPYRAFSSDSTALPVSQTVAGDSIVLAANNVVAATTVAITIQDAAGTISAPAQITVAPAPLFGGVTITANFNPACPSTTNAICSGGTGTAVVKLMGNGGTGLPSRQVRFDVVQGNFQIVTTNPAQPLAQTLTVVSDTLGNATAILSVPTDTPTQSGILRITDLASGQQITGAFDILQVTTGGEVLSVLPLGTTTITGPDNQHCSSGVVINYYIFGGTPPYTVSTNFPQAITIGGSPVLKSGGLFTATTTGACFTNGTFVITDATGRTIPGGSYPLISNNLGTAVVVPPVTNLIVTPGAIAKTNCVPANTFQFIGTGGTAPYSAVVTSTTSSTSPLLAPQTGIAQGTAVVVSGLTSPSSTLITLFDNSSPRQSGTVAIDCSGTPTPPPPSALSVTPPNYNYLTNTCVNKTSTFSVAGGTAPYTIFFTSGGGGGSITPTTLPAPGQFTVTGLTNVALTTNVTVVDSASPPLQQIVSISCPTSGAMTVEPAGGYQYSVAGTPSCSAATSNFVIQGGIPPYNVAFSVPGTTGTISPQTVMASGGGFSVTALANVVKANQITIRDSAATPQTLVRTIQCNP